jgi:pyridoxine/pyridoxamine 5'-phosphate oxidase
METKNLDIYGSEPLLWSRVLGQLEQAREKASYFLATTRPNGRPHLAGVGARWEDGKFYIVSGPGTRKSKNLADNPNCSLAVSLDDLDLVVEGTATKVTDPGTVARVVANYAAAGWPARAEGSVIVAPYSAPSAGPAPWDLYEMTPTQAIAVASGEPFGATRWRFSQ